MAGVTLEEAAAAVRRGDVIAIPTDTVYGLAADPLQPEAVAAVFSLKGRPPEKPLPVLAADIGSLEGFVRFDERALRLAHAFWPGGLTIVLPRHEGFTADLGGNALATVAVRVPSSETCLGLLRSTGPLAVTSANPSGSSPATDAASVIDYFGEPFPVLDGGPSAGEASTTISLAGGLRVLRAGPISEETLRQSLTS